MYQIVYPYSVGQIENEGKALNHCVSSYVYGVLEGKYLIAFLRKADAPETPLVTLMLKDGKVLMARGLNNRTTTSEEQEFLDQWQAQNKAA